MYTYHDIVKVLGSVYSHVLVDKISLFEPDEYIYAFKNVSLSDIGYSKDSMVLASAPFFLIMESVSQLAVLFAELSGYSCEIENINLGRLEGNILPGDTLCLELQVAHNIKTNIKKINLQGRVFRDGQVVCIPKIDLLKREGGLDEVSNK